MSYFKQLLSILKTEKKDDKIFIGNSQSVGSGRLYGGLLMAQALDALYQSAYQKNKLMYFLHSYHCYFIRPGIESKPVEYRIINKRDGNFFLNRSLEAYQNEKLIFSMNASFHQKEQTPEIFVKKSLELPSSLEKWQDLALKFKDRIPKEAHRFFNQKWPFDIYPLEGDKMFSFKPEKPIQGFWLKLIDEKDIQLKNIIEHQILFSYISDLMLLQTAGIATDFKLWQRKALYSSIDQGIWFHDDINTNDWLYFEVESPVYNDARGFVFGKLYNESGLPVATVTQEGLIREL